MGKAMNLVCLFFQCPFAGKLCSALISLLLRHSGDFTGNNYQHLDIQKFWTKREGAALLGFLWGIQVKKIFMSRSKNFIVATGLLAFAAGGMSFPFFFVKSKNKPIIDSSKPLPPQATFRGPYINTGSQDVGPDPKTHPKL